MIVLQLVNIKIVKIKIRTMYNTVRISLSITEREGFEPPVPLPAHLISSQAQSATLSSLL